MEYWILRIASGALIAQNLKGGIILMQLWKKLYLTVWLAFFSCVLISRWMGPLVGWPIHALLGLGLLAATWTNARQLTGLPVPSRLKRISKTAAGFAVFQLISGSSLSAIAHLASNLTIAHTTAAGGSCGLCSGDFGPVLLSRNGL